MHAVIEMNVVERQQTSCAEMPIGRGSIMPEAHREHCELSYLARRCKWWVRGGESRPTNILRLRKLQVALR